MSQPRYAKVDPADYYRLRKYEWLTTKKRNNFYVLRHTAGGKRKKGSLIYLHKEIIEVPQGMVVDHINHDAMDNRCANLRPATHSQNMCHVRKRSGAKSSKYKGVYYRKRNRKWAAMIASEKKKIFLGYFQNEIDAAKAYDAAARAYDEAAKKYHGEFASLNFENH